jgi:hypothetical protein
LGHIGSFYGSEKWTANIGLYAIAIFISGKLF